MTPIEPYTHPWIGRVLLNLHNTRDGADGQAEVRLTRHTATVHIDGREVTVILRDVLRQWLTSSHPAPLEVEGDLRWSVQPGCTCIEVGHALFTITPDSLRLIVAVI